jgi:inner membrane protein
MIFGHAAIAVIGYKALRVRAAPAAGIAFAIGSLFPDLDLLWWKFFSDQRTPHHLFWPHLPLFWMLLGALVFLVSKFFDPSYIKISVWFLLGVALHILLDTHAGGVAWLYPFSSKMFYLFPVSDTHKNFLISGVLHWTFILELPFIMTAAWILLKAIQNKYKS